MPLSQDHLERLRRYDTPTICNLIELFEVRPRTEGYMDARIRACFPELPPMVGFASTAAFRASMPPAGGEAYASIDDQIARFSELDGPAVVVFQDLDDPPVAATFGEVMCTTYRAFGAVGLITSGAGRDLEQVRALDFPVFTSGAICSHGYCHFLNVHLPVHVGGIVVRPNDLLHGDCNGVTTVPSRDRPGAAGHRGRVRHRRRDHPRSAPGGEPLPRTDSPGTARGPRADGTASSSGLPRPKAMSP
ncbi:MAG: hypothetical protein KatS3mg115_2080 [Candidatus Poribacteria bacterium]|nr:MAG: hypothetical protein KatS3mg115_2080 [Candidatus Poribacteria bacterium]